MYLRSRKYNNHLHGPVTNARLKKYLGSTVIYIIWVKPIIDILVEVIERI